VGAGLGEDVGDVALHREHAQHERPGDLGVGQPGRHQPQHLALSGRQTERGTGLGRWQSLRRHESFGDRSL
jgi:hypothetical protein